MKHSIEFNLSISTLLISIALIANSLFAGEYAYILPCIGFVIAAWLFQLDKKDEKNFKNNQENREDAENIINRRTKQLNNIDTFINAICIISALTYQTFIATCKYSFIIFCFILKYTVITLKVIISILWKITKVLFSIIFGILGFIFRYGSKNQIGYASSGGSASSANSSNSSNSSNSNNNSSSQIETECVFCGSRSYGPGCRNSTVRKMGHGESQVHKHNIGNNKCVYCGSSVANGPGCPFSPNGRHSRN